LIVLLLGVWILSQVGDDVGGPSAGCGATTAPLAVSADPLAATIDVHAGRRVRRIPRTLYGVNVEWTHDGMGLWDAKRGQLDSDLVQLSRELAVSSIRFPGGVYSDFYHWREGVGPQATRPDSLHFTDGPKSRHAFGTDEALAFARAVDGELLITVNAGSGTPEEAAEWVRYVNPENDSGALDRRVTFWEVGNELYIKEDTPISKSVTISPETYAERFIAFADAMRAADPDIKIGAIGGENAGRYNTVSYAGWDRTVLTKAGHALDFLAVHNAYAPLVWDKGDRDLRTVYQAMLAAPSLIRQNLETLSDQIEHYVPERADEITIAVTEWGPFFHADPTSPYVHHVKTLGSALFTASTLNVFIESEKVTVANAFKLNEISFMGWISQRNGRWTPNGPYFALQMYTRHFGDVLVDSTVDCPTFTSKALGVVEKVRGVPYLDVISGLSDDGETLYVLGVNKHFDAPIEATINIHDRKPRGDATVWTLTGSGIDANTGTQLPKVPGLKWGTQMTDTANPRFDKGNPQDVAIRSRTLTGVGSSFEFVFPKHSVCSVEIPLTPE
jgi:alpha-N-arabinofuranosidase